MEVTTKALIPSEPIERSILLIRNHKVIMDADLAEMYGVETKNLVRAMKRNIVRFPPDFMFQLSNDAPEKKLSTEYLFNEVKEEKYTIYRLNGNP